MTYADAPESPPETAADLTPARTASGLDPAELRRLQQLRPGRALASLAGTWLLLGSTIAIALASQRWWVWLLAALVVGRCQHALAVLMHEAAHHRLLPSRPWNDWVGQWLCAKPIASHLLAYRFFHLLHHQHLHTDLDPDLSLSRPYPCRKESWRRKLTRDLTGLSALTMRGYLQVDRATGRMRPGAGNLLRRWSWSTGVQRALVAAGVATLFALGLGPAFLILWLLPLLVVYQTLLRIRGVLEHAAVPDRDDPLRNARTVISRNPLARFFLNPHHVAYHLEHHLYPGVPHYHLPALHRALVAGDRFGSAFVETSYRTALDGILRPA